MVLETGITASQISGDGFYGFGQFGANLFGGVEWSAPAGFGGALALGFNQKGARKYQTANDFTTYRLRVNYLEIPVFLTYRWDKFRFGAGPGLNVRINHRERSMFGDIQPERSFMPFEFALNGCVAYELRDRVFLNLWFQNSLLPARAHVSGQVYPPNNFILGAWHTALLDRGQYFTSLMLTVRVEF